MYTDVVNCGKRAIAGGSLLVLALTFVPNSVLAQRTQLTTFDVGTVFPVKLQRELNSKKNEKGDRFKAVVKADADGYSGLPEGTIVEGVVLQAKAKAGKEPGVLDLAFRSIQLPSGKTYDIDGSVIGLDNKSVERTSDGRLVAKKKGKNNRLVYAGYGAGAGALVGLLAGGKLKLENILIGGALGYLAGSLEKGKSEVNDVTLKEGTEMGVRLERSVRVSTTSLSNRDDSDSESRDRARIRRENDRDTGSRLDRRRDKDEGDSEAKDRANIRRQQDDDAGEGAPSTPDSDSIGVLVEDREVQFSSNASPFNSKGVIMVPASAVADSMGASLKFESSSQRIVLKKGNDRATIGLGSKVMLVNGSRRVVLDGTAKKLNGEYYVPSKFFTLGSRYKVQWDAGSKTVIISSGNDSEQ
jgi:hypothetical protein